MINCPKCGFEQPPDKYCAQCGVNMETFRAPATPLARRLAGSGAFLGFLIGVVIFATAYLIYNHRKSALHAEAESNIATRSAPSQPTQFNKSEPAEAPEESLDQISQPETKSVGIKSLQTTTTFVSTTTTQVQVQAAGATRTEKKIPLNIQYAEVPLSAFTVLFAGLSEAGQSGIIPDFASRMSQVSSTKANESVRILKSTRESIQSGSLRINQSLQGGQGRGLNMTITLKSMAETLGLDIAIENKGLMAGNFGSDLSVQNFQGTFDLPLRAAIYFADVISKPAGLTPEMEADLGRDQIFKILNSPQFNQRQTSFFIFIENTGESSSAASQ
jgi:hypothetical protein